MQQTSPSTENRPLPRTSSSLRAWASRHSHTLVVVGIWALLIIGSQLYIWVSGVSYREFIASLSVLFRTPSVGPVAFIGLATLCPILLIPASTIGIVGGVIYGPALGILYTLIGCNISGSIAYAAGRLSSGELDQDVGSSSIVGQARAMLQRNTLLAVILLRLSLLPYNPVNYVIGMARVRWSTFIVANTIGSLPGLVLVILAGRSIHRAFSSLEHNPLLLIGAATLLVLIAAGAYLARRGR